MTGRPFQFRWGPGRLAGLGITLSPDQASCTDTIGKALVVAPLWDPTCDEPFQMQHPETDEGLVQPLILDVALNDDVTDREYIRDSKGYLIAEAEVTRPLQERMDSWHGQGWRTAAQVVGTNEDCSIQHGCWYEEPQPMPLWQAVMIDDATARRIETAAERAYHDTHLPLWGEYIQGINNGCLEEDDVTLLAEQFGISPATDEWGNLIEEPVWEWAACLPDFPAFLDPADAKLWTDLVASARQSWQTYDQAMGIQRYAGGHLYRHTTQFNPFTYDERSTTCG